jgi:hypothetical protein
MSMDFKRTRPCIRVARSRLSAKGFRVAVRERRLAAAQSRAGSTVQGVSEEDEFAGVARLGGDFVIGLDRRIRTRFEGWGFVAGTVNPTTHDRVCDGGVMDADVSGRRPR